MVRLASAIMVVLVLASCAPGQKKPPCPPDTLAEDVLNRRASMQKPGPDMAVLLRLGLSENPGPAEVTNYINTILFVSQNQKSYLPSDPQVTMLARVGRENLDALLRVARSYRPEMRYVVEAVKMLATEEDRPAVMAALRQHPPLIKVVSARGWTAGARDVLVALLREKPRYVPSDWIRALAAFEDPSTYGLLTDYLVNGLNRHLTYKYVKDLPGIDLAGAIPLAWENSLGNRHEYGALLEPALSVGHKPALDFAINALGSREFDKAMRRRARALVLRYTEAEGFNDEIKDWYRKFGPHLKFDPASGKFLVR